MAGLAHPNRARAPPPPLVRFTDPLFGAFCAVTGQLVCSTKPRDCNAGREGFGPLTLRDCDGNEVSQRLRRVPARRSKPPPADGGGGG